MTQAPAPPPALAAATATELAARRIILLDRALEDDNTSLLISQLTLLSQQDADSDIVLMINSPGGSVPGMLAIADTMALIPNDVRTVALGMAYSAGQFLLSAGTPGKRFALPHATVLLHQGSSGFGGSAVDISLQAEHMRRNRDVVLGLIAVHTGQSVERITADSQRDRIFEADEAKDYGFVDHIVQNLDAVLSVIEPRRLGPSPQTDRSTQKRPTAQADQTATEDQA
ncbi:ClpP family protease [Galactobacter sp.]|uniref:ClpP family protease n=1 Tax=Galactobacter sp. TaxID=2676125 RepID=UPI0025C180F5|nr:ATP-dependent Clp protease proteolytic subunit [Galactobacter sp.]